MCYAARICVGSNDVAEIVDSVHGAAGGLRHIDRGVVPIAELEALEARASPEILTHDGPGIVDIFCLGIACGLGRIDSNHAPIGLPQKGMCQPATVVIRSRGLSAVVDPL